jgi:predicted ABC-type ATPase
MKGGHDVPDEDVKRRYIRGLSKRFIQNFLSRTGEHK